MSDFKKTLKLALSFEFSKPDNALHQNPGETGLTFCGIYETAHPKWSGWTKIKEIIQKNKGNIKKASTEAYKDKDLLALVDDLYLKNYWDPYRLGELNQTAAEEIFVFGINAGMKMAIKKAQFLAGVLVDGEIGAKTIAAINAIPEAEFDMKFDEQEILFYESLIAKKPSFEIFRNGWHKRAKTV
jgi:lysozyme family protein